MRLPWSRESVRVTKFPVAPRLLARTMAAACKVVRPRESDAAAALDVPAVARVVSRSSRASQRVAAATARVRCTVE
ncbi:hypothetical protein V5799_026277 [Amblyomma americanum]|uniref:Uncharacterized protein n=1 Tax=Amblyomma americanum TaxID=6943 RepID=A0AAQ4DJ15_AMBAM